ncbi:MAG: FecR domain-containing protein [Bacteroidales bacterium]|nr:FecR domain-containing protein [Bacteroidales bacterium]
MRKDMTDSEIVKFFSGNCTELEKNKIENWRKMSDKNERLFDEFQAVWENTVAETPDFDVEASLEKVNQKIAAFDSNPDSMINNRYGRSRTLRYIYRVAASIVLLTGLYFGYRSIQQHKDVSRVTVNTVINERVELKLSDGSIIWINSSSTFTYPKEFTGNERRVKLTGEAYFKITKDTGKPFIIETEHAAIKVLGTSFNVRAMDEENEEIVSVSEGLVRVNSLDDNTITTKIAAGEQCVLNKETQAIEKSVIRNENFDSWKTRKIVFQSTAMKDVAQTLSNYFETSILIGDEYVGNMELTTTFSEPQLEDVLKVIELTDEVIVTHSGEHIILKKKN